MAIYSMRRDATWQYIACDARCNMAIYSMRRDATWQCIACDARCNMAIYSMRHAMQRRGYRSFDYPSSTRRVPRVHPLRALRSWSALSAAAPQWSAACCNEFLPRCNNVAPCCNGFATFCFAGAAETRRCRASRPTAPSRSAARCRCTASSAATCEPPDAIPCLRRARAA